MTTAPSDLVLAVSVAVLNAEELPNLAGWGIGGLRAALCEKHEGDCTKKPWTCDACIAERAVEVGRAAIMAMRDIPSEFGDKYFFFDTGRDAWRDMIDAILGEGACKEQTDLKQS